jgi:uncharacterized protein (UPF0335 family)
MTNLDADLKAFVDRIENIEKQIAEYTQDRKDIYAEAKSKGYEVSALKEVLKERALDEAKRKKRKEKEDAIALYKLRLGMLSDLPLGQAALARAGAS